MSGRIVVFGATGYTGRLVSEALVRRQARPVLAGRTREKLDSMAAELGGLETAVADVADPTSVRALVEGGDVLVSTVGPFIRWGDAALGAAIDARAHYLDSTGEPAFIRKVFEEYGPRAEAAGIGMLTAFGYDWVPGNLAGGLVLDEAGSAAARVDVGYFTTGRPPAAGKGLGRLAAGMGGMSGGTFASTLEVMARPGYAFRDGRLVTERTAKRVRSFDLGKKRSQALSVAGSEHFSLPRVAPGLREVNVYLGWFGPLTRVMQAQSAALALPGAQGVVRAAAARVSGSTGGPDAEARGATGSLILASAHDSAGTELASVRLKGPNGYTFTGDILAWGAIAVASGGLKATGALGPVDGFGLEELREGVESTGLRVQ